MEISVIITNFNTGKYLTRSIRSVLNQSFNPNEMEVLVVDDGSEDDSIRVMNNFGDRIVPIINGKNTGLAVSCNLAVKMARGKFTIFVDADDFVSTNILMVEHDFLSHNKESIDAASCDYYEVSEKETILKRRDGMAFPIRCGIMFYTDHLIELGPYNTNIQREDLDFRSRFLKSGRFIYNIMIPYYRYTQRESSLTKNIK